MAYVLKSQESLLNLAMFYCSKRETSRARLAHYLKRKCREQEISEPIYSQWIEPVLNTCEEKKMVDDHRYAEILVRDYTGRGKGKKYIENKLKEKGIRTGTLEIVTNETEEFERAIALAQKVVCSLTSKVTRKAEKQSSKPQKSKYQRPMNEKFELKQKMIQKLVTSGFSLNLSRKAADQVLTE